VEASSEAAATAVVSVCERSAVAEATGRGSSCVEADDTSERSRRFIDSKLRVMPSTGRPRRSCLGINRRGLVGGLFAISACLTPAGCRPWRRFRSSRLVRDFRAEIAFARACIGVTMGQARPKRREPDRADANADDDGGAEDGRKYHEAEA